MLTLEALIFKCHTSIDISVYQAITGPRGSAINTLVGQEAKF